MYPCEILCIFTEHKVAKRNFIFNPQNLESFSVQKLDVKLNLISYNCAAARFTPELVQLNHKVCSPTERFLINTRTVISFSRGVRV